MIFVNLILVFLTLFGAYLVWRSASKSSLAPHDRSDVIFWYIISSTPTVTWFFIMIQSLSGLATRAIPIKSGSAESSAIASIILVFANIIHFACSMTGYEKAKRVLIVLSTVGVLIFCLEIGGNSVGGFILRIAKLGGNSPITYKANDGTEVKGCLVWLSSSYFIIADRRKHNTCPPVLHTYFSKISNSKISVRMIRRETIEIIPEKTNE